MSRLARALSGKRSRSTLLSAWPAETSARSTDCFALHDDPICMPDRDADVHDIASLVDVHNDLLAP